MMDRLMSHKPDNLNEKKKKIEQKENVYFKNASQSQTQNVGKKNEHFWPFKLLKVN